MFNKKPNFTCTNYVQQNLNCQTSYCSYSAHLCHKRVIEEIEWHSVAFNDKRRFWLHASDGCLPVRHLPECIQPHYKSPIPSIIVLGVINYKSHSPLVFVKGTFNSTMYANNIGQPV